MAEDKGKDKEAKEPQQQAQQQPAQDVFDEDLYEEFENEGSAVKPVDENVDLWVAEWDDEGGVDGVDFQKALLQELDKGMKE